MTSRVAQENSSLKLVHVSGCTYKPQYIKVYNCRTLDKRKQVLKMRFLINEHNVSVMYIDINAISLYIDVNIFQQDEYFCSKLGMEVGCNMLESNLKTSLSQIWVICQLLPFVRGRQISLPV